MADVVFREAVEEVVRQPLRQGDHRLVAGIDIAQQEAVNPPRLPARPAGVIGIALLGIAVARRAGYHVHIIGVERGGIVADEIVCRLHDVRFCGVSKARIPRLLRRPVQQRQVHGAVDDHPSGLLRV